MTLGAVHGPNAPPPSLARTIAGLAGNILEWYDFAVFGYFSKILGDVFFPPDQEGNAALLESFAVFGGAFMARPIGGILMGYIGDTYGRKRALELR
jgi:MFS transporter, MHS family, proline/betaine transporter